MSLTGALKEGDFIKCERIGKSMKSSGALYGFKSISTLGDSIEKAAQNKDKPTIQKWIAYLDSYLKNMDIKLTK